MKNNNLLTIAGSKGEFLRMKQRKRFVTDLHTLNFALRKQTINPIKGFTQKLQCTSNLLKTSFNCVLETSQNKE